jgi:hypothetical protein
MIRVIVHVTKAVVAVITALLFFSCGLDSNFKKIDGNGNVVTKNRDVKEDFKSVSASNGLEVIIEQGVDKAIIVEADDNLQQHIKTEISGGELKITADVNIGSGSKKVFVRMPTIEKIASESEASVTNKNVLRAETLDLSSESGSSLNVTIEAERVNCESSSGSGIKINGTANKLYTKSASGSSIDAKKLSAKEVTSEASSGSSTTVNAVESLSADAASGGKIRYTTTPEELNQQSDSGGSVQQD